MDTITTIKSHYNFIEFHRTFHELSENAGESEGSEDLDLVRKFGIGEGLRWSDLLKEFRLVILSEAGSGKTVEIRNKARTLGNLGKPSFFLRLEHISRDFEDAFEVGSFESFEAWLASNDEGWLLLDSVDEARLRNPGDFELAIRKLSRRIIAAKDRTHIVITGRTTAWRPKTDLDLCNRRFPYAAADMSEHDTQANNDGSESILRKKTKKSDRDRQGFKIFALDDLTSDQIALFVKARGIEDSQAFLDAVERADAWSFTSRPQDLEELAQFWIDEGRIGTRLEIMRNSVDRRLSERDQNRAEIRPFSTERARQGARLLAAATTLAHEQTIRVPDGADNTAGIAVQSVLLDWDDREQSALLSRPIFDEAIYGAVRFHHRTVREYLTAEWFSELLKRGASRRKIETLFFRKQYGLDIVVPAMRPVLPWLAILDDRICERVRKIEPEIFFEGGDPCRLPLEVRRQILHDVCEKMADRTDNRSMREYEAAQRFASPDLTEDVRKLIDKYANHRDLTEFLVSMVWIGQLADALPEVKAIALTSTAEHFTRIYAFKAINAIGSADDQEKVRQSFLTEASELEREWLAELVKGMQPTEQTINWLLACLEKSEPRKPFSIDNLARAVTAFAVDAEIELIPRLVAGLNRLLGLPPTVERRYSDISEKFTWLMAPACKSIERLILDRHSASLEPDALSILHKFYVVREYDTEVLSEIKAEFSQLVPAWKELNRALFWFEVQRTREAIEKKRGERLTEFWRASIFGSFWRFEESDFDCVSEEIYRQTLQDDRLVALSLAFHLYISAGRPRKWRERLKKLTAENDELSYRLGTYLRPPAQSQKMRLLKREEARWKKSQEARRKKRDKFHADWKKYFIENMEEIRAALHDKPGTITNPLLYLSEKARKRQQSSTRWTEYNWKTLISEYGEEVAQFYRDSAVSFWRRHKPKLVSEGAPLDKTTYAVVIGLTGLEIEAHESQGWPRMLSEEEVELACRYASFELNGFPTWFPKLFETHPSIVSNFLLREVQYELSIEKPETETHYIISDLSWSGQWAWDRIAPDIYEYLKKKEPKNFSNLEKLLKIIQGSTLPDDSIEKLASRKCRTLKKRDHAACWFAVWTGVAPDKSIPALEERFEKISDPKKRTLFAMMFATRLWGNHRDAGNKVRQAFKTPEYLKSLYLLMQEQIRIKDDIDRIGGGAYTPGLRDNAQDARDGLLGMLNQIPGKESFLALNEIAGMHPEAESRPWILRNAKKRAELDGDISPWSPLQVRDFHEMLERTPSNHGELAELAVLRILDLKDDLENGDTSIAGILRTITQETTMRKYIGKELREKAFGRYSVPQEEELADSKKPDLRFHGMGFDQPVPVELKLSDKWSGPELFERLENQLCGDYLRDNRSSRGIFMLVYQGNKSGWDLPGKCNRVDFTELIVAVQNHWRQISSKFPNVDDITVIGIDLARRHKLDITKS